jgi:hypothetical protein
MEFIYLIKQKKNHGKDIALMFGFVLPISVV